MTSWNKLSKFTQWKKITSYMNEQNIKNDFLFKRMRSMISEKRTDNFVQYDIEQQKITTIDFQHIEFIRERSKKGKLKVQEVQKEQDTIEILEEQHIEI